MNSQEPMFIISCLRARTLSLIPIQNIFRNVPFGSTKLRPSLQGIHSLRAKISSKRKKGVRNKEHKLATAIPDFGNSIYAAFVETRFTYHLKRGSKRLIEQLYQALSLYFVDPSFFRVMGVLLDEELASEIEDNKTCRKKRNKAKCTSTACDFSRGLATVFDGSHKGQEEQMDHQDVLHAFDSV